MRGELPPDSPPRIVKPRKPGFTFRPIITVTTDKTLIERTGLFFPTSELPSLLVTEPSSIIVAQGFGPVLEACIAKLGKRADFNYRVTPRYRESRNVNAQGDRFLPRIHDAVVNYIGFRDPAQPKKKAGKYHYPLDPVHFCRGSIDELYPDDRPRFAKLCQWAMEVREWCAQQQLEVKTAAGGLAAQLLKDPRFNPEPRRKAPRLINDIARIRLPGNYYRLHADRNREYKAIYLDMSNAHHAMARNIAFPDVNTLHKYGRSEADTEPRPYAHGDDDLINSPGLFRIQLHTPHIPLTRFPLPYMESGGMQTAWIFSNELPAIRELGGEIRAIYTAIVAEGTDSGLNKYARYAIEQIEAHKTFKPWLKPVLHAPYGLLAARPDTFETGYYRAKSGEKTEYPMGRVSIPVIAKKSKHVVESRLANVIHRGMIEAEVRKEALWFARYLREVDHHDVLAIYADSVFIRDTGKPVRLLPPPWRIAETCSGLTFLDPTHFVSRELTRLPGMPRDRRGNVQADRLQRREMLVNSLLHTNRSRGGSNAASQDNAHHRRDPRDASYRGP